MRSTRAASRYPWNLRLRAKFLTLNYPHAVGNCLPGGHPLRAVQPDRLAVDVGVLEDVVGERRVLLGAAEPPRVRDVGGELGERLLPDPLHDRRPHGAWRDRDHPDAERPEVARG